jgi:putative N6-adenine-specific DNA methylase
MCGSGTFLCEAALIALDRAPGLDREFAFQRLAIHDDAAWNAIKARARQRVRKPDALPIFGSDRYGEALKLARANLRALGVDQLVMLKQADVLEMRAPAPSGLLVTNPPYGVRLEDQNALAALYPKLGDALKKKYAGWIAHIFTADLRLPKLIGLSASRRTPLYNGALECRLFEFKLIAGSMRRQKRGAGDKSDE